MRCPYDVVDPSGSRRMNRRGHPSVGCGDHVATLYVRTLGNNELRRFSCMLPKRENELVRIRHAPYRKLRCKLLVLWRMDPVREPEGARAASHPVQKARARSSHFSRSFSFALSGVPG